MANTEKPQKSKYLQKSKDMKFPKLNYLFLLTALLMATSCSEEEDAILSVKESSSFNGFPVLDPTVECELLSGYESWDDVKLCIGDVRTYAIQPHPSSIYIWTKESSHIEIISQSQNFVTIKAVKEGVTKLHVTRNVSEEVGTCARSGTIEVTCVPEPKNHQIAVGYPTWYNSKEVCYGDVFTLTATQTPGKGFETFIWEVYNVELINGSKVTDSQITVRVNSMPGSAITFNLYAYYCNMPVVRKTESGVVQNCFGNPKI